jgi:hypothetical protein
MRKMPWAVYLWPGLPQLWWWGHWVGLAMALGAALILNGVLLVCFGWSELVSAGMRKILLIGLAGLWTILVVIGYVQTKRHKDRKQPDPAKDTFTQAMNLYLKGDSFQAECMLVEIRTRNERVLDARLLLATLYRHNRRYDEAAKQLDTLIRCEGADKWELEIQQERMLIAEGRKNADEQETTNQLIEPRPRTSRAA